MDVGEDSQGVIEGDKPLRDDRPKDAECYHEAVCARGQKINLKISVELSLLSSLHFPSAQRSS